MVGWIAWIVPHEGVVIADLERGEMIHRIESAPATELAFSLCGGSLVLNSDEIVIRRCVDWSEVGHHPGSAGQLNMRSLAISPDSGVVAAVVKLKRILLLDLHTGALLAALHASAPAHPIRLAFSPPGAPMCHA